MVNIKQKNSSVPGKAPLPADLERGELAVNLADKKLFTKDQTDAIVGLGGGAEYVPDLKDVTVAAAPYNQPPSGSGYLTRVGGKSAGDADEYQLTPVNFITADNPPANPHVGMMWLDTSSTMMNYVWNGTAWVRPGAYTPPGTYTVQFTIEVVSGNPVGLTLRPTGATAAQCTIDWGDGNKTVGSFTGTNTYNLDKAYTVTAIISPESAIFDGNGGWPQWTGCAVKKIGPFSSTANIREYLDHGDDPSWYPDLAEMDYTGITPSELNWFNGLFKHRPFLFPSGIVGVNKDLIIDLSNYMENRADIDSFIWADGAEITQHYASWKGSGLTVVPNTVMPKSTQLKSAFEGTRLTNFGEITAPNCNNLDYAFKDATIANFNGFIDVGSQLVNMYQTFYQTTIQNNSQTVPMVKTTSTDYLVAEECFNAANIPNVVGLRVSEQYGKMFYSANIQRFIQMRLMCGMSGTSHIFDPFEGINASQIVEFDMQFDVDPRYDSNSNGEPPWTRDLRGMSNLTKVGAAMLQNATKGCYRQEFAGSAPNTDNFVTFAGAALSAAEINKVLNDLLATAQRTIPVCPAAGGTPANGLESFEINQVDLRGGINATPDTAGQATITSLQAFGITVLTN